MIIFEYIGFAVVLVMLEFIVAYIVGCIREEENYELGLVASIGILDIFVVGVFVTFINHPDVFGYMYIGG